jgi:hypothetical protein
MTGLVLGAPVAANATHGTSTLDVAIETAAATTGASNDVVAKLTSPAAADLVINAEITGPNDPDVIPGLSPESPDKTCPIAKDADTCTLTFAPAQPAPNQQSVVDTFYVWVAGHSPDTGEGVDEAKAPGLVAEPDVTDVVIRVTNAQVLPPVRTLDCVNAAAGEDSEKPNSGPSSKETYTCNVKTQSVNTPNVTVDVENMGGPNDVPEGPTPASDYTCGPTDANGNCTVVIPTDELTNGQVGTAFLCFWVDDNADDANNSTIVSDGGACPEQWDVEASQDIAQTDVLKITWEVPVASVLDITAEDPTGDALAANANVVFPTILKDQFGNPLAGGNVDFKVLSGPNKKVAPKSDMECTTIADGTCSITHVPNSFKFAGTDKVCVWLDEGDDDVYDPDGALADGGSCATESASPGEDDPDDDLADRGQVMWTGNPAPTVLELDPDSQNATASTTVTVTATLFDDQEDPLPGYNIDFEITGVSDPDGGDTPDTPDTKAAPYAACMTDEDGQCTLNIKGAAVGDTQIRGWVDIDNNDNATADGEVDATEGPVQDTTPGLVAEPDTTDVVTIKWASSPTVVTIGRNASVILNKQPVSLGGTLKDIGGTPIAGKKIVLERRIGGQSLFSTLANATTDANGRWAWTGRPASSAEYRASFLGELPGLRSSKSNIITVAVRVIFDPYIVSATRLPPGGVVTFSGRVDPKHPNKRVYLQVAGPNNTWKNAATTLLDGNGGFRMTYRRNVAGTLGFRVLYQAQDADHGGNLTTPVGVRWG